MAGLIPESERAPVPSAFLDGAWINAKTPPTRNQLRGSPTLVVRFHAGSLPGLASLTAASANPHAKALGLHVPDHPHEAQHRTVKHAVLREALQAPIRHDPGGLRADALNLEASPSHLLLDEEARIAQRFQQPPGPDTWRLARTLATGPAPSWTLRGHAPPPTPLLYPQGLDADDARIALADTGHHRILVHGPNKSPRAIGSGLPGHEDGSLERARFSHPRGLHLAGEHLLVADTGNNAIRRIRLDDERVDTVLDPAQLAPETDTPLGPMPWDLHQDPHDETLVHVTLPGANMLVKAHLDPTTEDSALVSTLPLKQPTGITEHQEDLLVAQPAPPRVLRVPSSYQDPAPLEFADRLEHPIALDANQDILAIADPYAGTVHALDPDTGTPLDRSPSAHGLPEPRAVTHQRRSILYCDAEHRVLRSRETLEDPETIDIHPPRPQVDRFTRLDPLEVAPRGTLELEIVLRDARDASPETPGPDVQGPIRTERVTKPTRDQGSLWARIEGRMEASGTVTASWGLEEQGDRFYVAWSLPVLLRPGGPDRADARLSARRPRGRGDKAPSP